MRTFTLPRVFGCTMVGFLLFFSLGTLEATELGIEGTRFTLDGKPTFLYGISYYGAIGAPKTFIEQDLRDMKKLGIHWIRVWGTWSAFDNDVTVFDNEGKPRDPYWKKLVWLIKQCDRQGIIVDITLTRGGRVVDQPRICNMASHRQAVSTLVSKLKPYRNWYLDLANERNIKDKRFVSFKELQELTKLAKKIDPQRLITASHAGDIPEKDLRTYLLTVGVDFISPHRPRNGKSAKRTASRTKEYLASMKQFGRVVPVHYQEPFRRGFSRGWEPKVETYVADVLGSIAGDAAGWCLHNGDQRRAAEGKPRRSFDMRAKRLFDQLDAVERKVIQRLQPLVTKQNR